MKLKHFFALLILLVPSFVSLLRPGYYGASDDMHIGWLFEMHQAVQSGKFPARFVPDLSFGYGYPLFNFVYPLPFYLGEIFHQAFSLVDSVKIVFLVSLLSSGLAMYLLARRYSSSASSLLAALVYVYAPYRSTDIYVRGALGESFAFIFPPLILLALSKPSRRWVGIGAMSLAALILSHNIAAYMFVPFAILFALINKISLRRFLSIFILGITASSYFWLPALKDSSLLKYDTVFNFADHFPTLRQLVTPYWGYGASVPGPYDGMSFYIGTLNLAGMLVAPLFFVASKNKRLYAWAYASLAISLFFMNFRSSFAWQNLPLLPYFQFPWRFLSITVLASSLLISQISLSPKLLILPISLLVLFSAPIFRPHDFLGRTDSYYLNRYIPLPKASSEYLQTQEEYLRLPKDIESRPTSVAARVSSSPYVSDIRYINPYDAKFIVDSPAGFVATYNKYNFPGWVAQVDGKPVSISSGSPYSQINIAIPSGKHSVSVSFQETYFNLLLDLLSAAALFVCIKFLAYEKKQ